MRQVFEAFFEEVDGRPAPRRGVHRIEMLPTTSHVYFGSMTGASGDGRYAGSPLSEGISPVQGADRNGPTAVFRSAAKMDHVRTGGTLLNMKFAPALPKGRRGSSGSPPSCAVISRWTAITSSSTSSMPPRCAPRRRSR